MAKPTQITKRVSIDDIVNFSKANTWGGTFGGTWGATWGGFTYDVEGHPTPLTTKRVGTVGPGTVTN